MLTYTSKANWCSKIAFWISHKAKLFKSNPDPNNILERKIQSKSKVSDFFCLIISHYYTTFFLRSNKHSWKLNQVSIFFSKKINIFEIKCVTLSLLFKFDWIKFVSFISEARTKKFKRREKLKMCLHPETKQLSHVGLG